MKHLVLKIGSVKVRGNFWRVGTSFQREFFAHMHQFLQQFVVPHVQGSDNDQERSDLRSVFRQAALQS